MTVRPPTQKPLKCLKCGGQHKLIDCKHVSDDEKKELWEKYKKTWNTSKNKNESASHKANVTTTSNETTKSKCDKSNSKTDKRKEVDHTVNAVIKSGSSQLRPLHWAPMASTTSKSDDDSLQKYSELSEWLIHSGCSNHMKPFKDDLISNITKSKSLVEVANGNIVKVPNKGTALIRIFDVKQEI